MKRDLNLIPKKRSTGSYTSLIFLMVVSLLIMAIAAYLGITIPNSILDAKKVQINTLQIQIDGLSDVDMEFENSLERLSIFRLQGESFSKLSLGEAAPLEVLKALEESCPEEIVMNSISYADGTISITGSMPDDLTLARLLVGIQRTDIFESYDINFTTSKDSRMYPLLEGESDLGRIFSISIQLSANNSQEEEGSDGQ